LTNSTTSLIKGNSVALTPASAWHGGTSARVALRECPEDVKRWLVTKVADLCRFVDANKTINTTEDLTFSVMALVDEFPVMKIEEFQIVFDNMKRGKYGKYYERLKLPEIIECCRRYESEERAPILEAAHKVDAPRYDPSKITYKPTKISSTVREALSVEQKQRNAAKIAKSQEETAQNEES